MKRFARNLTALGLLGLGVAFGSVAFAQPAPQQGQAPAQPPEQSAGPQIGGLLGVFATPAAELSLSEDQKSQLDDLLQSAAERQQLMVETNGKAMAALAEQIRAGSIDRQALADVRTDFISAWDAVNQGDLADLEQLHGILDAEQRGQLADAIEERMDKMSELDVDEFVGGLSKQLQLTEDQVSAIRGAVNEQRAAAGAGQSVEAARERLANIVTAFRGDTFDAAQVAGESQAAQAIDNMIAMTEAIVPILNEEQRARFATMFQGGPQQPGAQGGLGKAQQGLAYGGGWGRGGYGYGGGYRGGYGYGGGYRSGYGGYYGGSPGYGYGYGYPGGYSYGYGYPGGCYSYIDPYGRYVTRCSSSYGYSSGYSYPYGGWGY